MKVEQTHWFKAGYRSESPLIVEVSGQHLKAADSLAAFCVAAAVGALLGASAMDARWFGCRLVGNL